ncbi:hypothetical protein EV127DRAFT_499904, partial [Xylaria flabelliformis]
SVFTSVLASVLASVLTSVLTSASATASALSSVSRVCVRDSPNLYFLSVVFPDFIMATSSGAPGIVAVPEVPPVLDRCIFLGINPHHGLQPVFVRQVANPPSEQNALRTQDTLGHRAYLRATSYGTNSKCHFIPPISLYRRGTLPHIKKCIREAASSSTPATSFDTSPASSFPGSEFIWANCGPFYTSDLLILWPEGDQDLPDASIFAVRWNLESIEHPLANHPLDMNSFRCPTVVR